MEFENYAEPVVNLNITNKTLWKAIRGNTAWFGYNATLNKKYMGPDQEKTSEYALRYNENEQYLLEFDDTIIFNHYTPIQTGNERGTSL